VKTEYPDRITKPIQVRLDTSRLAFPKPGPREKAQPKDGRLIERAGKYQRTKAQMWARQSGRCAKCDGYMPRPSFGHRHHPGGRGLGGSKRDDSKTLLWCANCHILDHEEQRKPKGEARRIP
jgi:hypothetical protein